MNLEKLNSHHSVNIVAHSAEIVASNSSRLVTPKEGMTKVKGNSYEDEIEVSSVV